VSAIRSVDGPTTINDGERTREPWQGVANGGLHVVRDPRRVRAFSVAALARVGLPTSPYRGIQIGKAM
jgi:hypothetical protein